MTDPIHDIVKRLAILEGRITPTQPHGSQNPQQKSVHQLPALFKPGKGGPILGGDPNKKAVTKGYFVGAESASNGVSVLKTDYDLDQIVLTLDINGKRQQWTFWDYDENFDNAERKEVFSQLQQQPWYKGLDHPTKMEILDASYKAIRGEEPSEYRPTVGDEPMNDVDILGEEQANEEKLLDKVKKSFIDYLDSVEDTVAKKKDRDISDKPADKGIGQKAKDKDIIAKSEELDEDPTQEPAPADTPTAPIQEPTYAAEPSAPIKTITLEDGRICEIHGNEHSGFEIRHGNRRLPSRFKNLDHATLALEMWQANSRRQDLSADYIDEA